MVDAYSTKMQGATSMRMMLRILIAMPINILFCLAYLFLLTLEVWRDMSRSHQRTQVVTLAREVWSGPTEIRT